MLGWLIAMTASPSAEWIAHYQDVTHAGIRCDIRAAGDDVTVCGRRDADRYRVPLIEIDPGDPRHESVAGERQRLLARTTTCQEHSLFQIGCGMAGVSVSTQHGLAFGTKRPLAP